MKRAILAVVVGLACFACGGAGSSADTSADVAAAQDAVVAPDQSCVASGGTVTSAMCCGSVSGFPNSCLVGACGCSPTYSHTVPVCSCGPGRCFDGTRCVADPRIAEASCRASGGTVNYGAMCCNGVGDFPSTCLVGACGCAPTYSHRVMSCQCPSGKCFDGSRCR